MRDFRFPGVQSRIGVLTCGTGFLKLLHFEFARQGIVPTQAGLKMIAVTGDHLERRWRDLIEQRWGVSIVNRYSISEIFGGARQSPDTGLYRFDPTVVAEVVDCWTLEPLSEGPGLLLLTELYPFSTYQPAIRYVTGDLMEAVAPALPDAPAEFRFLGRLRDAVACEQSKRLLTYPAPLAEALDAFPMLARSERWKTLALDAQNGDLGEVRGDIALEEADGRQKLRLRLVPKFSPACFPEAADRLKHELAEAIMGACPALRGLDAPQLCIELVSEKQVTGCIAAN